ncbi:MAG: diguanylate cyclase [Dehalobacter sp. 4CP]|uniref:GGDEF domain-containing protein n=1 Tax=Dehalobacter sp. CP TaxID=2594474 RepID=UPI0013CD2389|nr:diguanylate cyclase [Dehalobacter sp. 4CP]
MQVFLRIDINLVALVLLGVVFLIAYQSLDRQDRINKKFLTTSLVIMLELVFETLTCMINRRPELWLIPVSELMHICLFITAPLLTYSWYKFNYSWTEPDSTIFKTREILYFIPIVINTVLTVLSPIYGFIFNIDSANVYHRGSLFLVSAVITYFYLIVSLIHILKRKGKIIKQEWIPMIGFGILPIIGGILQSLFYGVLLMWSCTAFSLVIIYYFLQQRMAHLDNLTGVWTRGSFDYYISRRIHHKADDKFGLIYADLDGLKQINDQYGHSEGDKAIQTAVGLIRSVLRKTDIIARMGGDEFAVIMECDSKEALEKTIERINVSFEAYNKTSGKRYRLEGSFGTDIFDMKYASIEQFLNHVDNLMYSQKRIKKADLR